MDCIKVMIADDHAIVREGIVAILSLHEDVRVVGQAADGAEAVKMAEALKPDIILMDISMPGLGGMEATVEIRKRIKDQKIIVLTQYDDKEYVSRFLQAGVSGYILKKAVGSDLIAALRAVAKGDCYLYPSIATDVIGGFLSKKSPKVSDPFEKVTDRERQVLKLIAEGMSHKDIAEVLGISIKTVIAHQSNLSEKLDIHSRAGLIKYAFQKGLVKVNP